MDMDMDMDMEGGTSGNGADLFDTHFHMTGLTLPPPTVAIGCGPGITLPQ